MEAAGGVLSSVSLLVQLIDQVEALREFWQSFKDASNDVALILHDLNLLKDLLKDRANTLPVPSTLLVDVITKCEKKMVPLVRIVQEIEPGFKSRHKTVRLWSSYKTVKKAAYIKKFQDALHDAKGDLILVNQQISEWVDCLTAVLSLALMAFQTIPVRAICHS
jgi:hypothetical protein